MKNTVHAKLEAVALAKDRLVQANADFDRCEKAKSLAAKEQREAWDALAEAQKALMEAI